MKLLATLALGLCLTALVCFGAAKRQHGETVAIFDGRTVQVTAPGGWTMTSVKDERGLMTVRVADRQRTVSLEITFVPDEREAFAEGRARREFMADLFQEYVASSVEQGMQFEELQPRVGDGTYCVFTDRALVGATAIPENEFLNVTVGVKAWPGVVALFTLFSNGTDTKEYRAAMKMLRDSVHERAGPLR